MWFFGGNDEIRVDVHDKNGRLLRHGDLIKYSSDPNGKWPYETVFCRVYIANEKTVRDYRLSHDASIGDTLIEIQPPFGNAQDRPKHSYKLSDFYNIEYLREHFVSEWCEGG